VVTACGGVLSQTFIAAHRIRTAMESAEAVMHTIQGLFVIHEI
jgi:hypothetical protein